jgi:predicted nucleotidyltransferase
MPDLIQLVAELAAAFDRLKLRYALGGALATSYWGIERSTQDIDCLAAISAVSYQALADALAEIGCEQLDDAGNAVAIDATRMREQAGRRHLIEFVRRGVRVKIFVPVVPLQNEILKRAVLVPVASQQVPVTSAEDLVLLKMAFHRQKDLQDIRGILRVQRERLDFE